MSIELQPLPQPAAAGPGTVEERLRTLETLRERGLLSEQEYQRLRTEVLDELGGKP